MRHRLYIRHMVCPRCVYLVREELAKLGYEVGDVALGTADVTLPAGAALDAAAVRAALEPLGFELLQDPQDQLVEQIKAAVIQLVHFPPADAARYTASVWLSQHLGRDYRALSHAFSARVGLTLEKFIIRQRVERAKELLSYPDQRPVATIAAELGYSSAAHLTNQFRQVTGLTPTQFRQQGAPRRSLDALV